MYKNPELRDQNKIPKCLFLMSDSYKFSGCLSDPKCSESRCVICDQTPCCCERNETSLKKLIQLFLKKATSKCEIPTTCEECRHCPHTCPKNQWVAKVLNNILRKTSCENKEDDETIEKIILRMVDPSECERNPCQDHCNPFVQKVLKAILKKAIKCDCRQCPCTCYLNPRRPDCTTYKYWFRTTKDDLRKEICGKPKFVSCAQIKKCKCCPKETEETCTRSNTEKCRPREKDSKIQNCGFCQTNNRLICPRYVTTDCPTQDDSFSICADCTQCRIKSINRKDYSVALLCTECKPVNSPFVQFTQNGYPFRETPERRSRIQIRTKFLQINDFRPNSPNRAKSVYNPFVPKSQTPRKKRRKCKKGN